MRISDWSSDVCSSDLHVEKDERERNPEATPGYSPVAAGSRTEISWLRKSGRITVGNLWEFVPYNDPITIGMASPALVNQARSEERRVGKECVSTCRSRWSP